MSSIPSTAAGHGVGSGHGTPMRHNTRFNNGLLGILFFLCTEVALFGSLIFAYLYLRGLQIEWPPPGVERPAVALGALNAVILISSSAWCHFAETAVAKGKRARSNFWLLLTIISGSVFVSVQVVEYHNIRGATWSGSHADMLGASFFTLTGLHGAHVTIGVLCWIIILIQNLRGRWTPAHHFPVRGVGLYWHFVDAVWVLLFTIFYLV